MVRTKIDWPGLDYLWNPVTGCKRGCPYCVVRKRVWPRIKHCYGGHDFDKVIYQLNQSTRPLFIKKPSTFFVGFYSDCEYWQLNMWAPILRIIEKCSRHTFMFLSKNPLSYFGITQWPKNTMQGLTLNLWTNAALSRRIHRRNDELSTSVPIYRAVIGLDSKSWLQEFERVIVGAMTGPGAVKPLPEWIQSIKDHVPAEKIYWKKNIRGYLWVNHSHIGKSISTKRLMNNLKKSWS